MKLLNILELKGTSQEKKRLNIKNPELHFKGFYLNIMKTKLEILEIMQMMLDKKENDEFSLWYWEAVTDLAFLLWKDKDNYWLA